ncbi:hypothetical protein O6H91_10G029200 [Diphasiastrum complanatum]|uniref:Uncharacterized protein n=3 Tax=Diphasiastrum complanatum TaxID=34168 RepID=A0ACC2CFL3_DIPCM|nr:hypothetical protein O6H91_10G029200 [Diphasiastrum complanatum]KAJ7540756.1 hypothetical protein O6H91_10G029200 [Diphasiastrum complanatum]
MKKSLSKERKILRLALEAYPLRAADTSASHIHSIAVTKEGDSYLLYIGTNNGRLLLYAWKPSLVPPPPSVSLLSPSLAATDNFAAFQRNGASPLSMASPIQNRSNDAQSDSVASESSDSRQSPSASAIHSIPRQLEQAPFSPYSPSSAAGIASQLQSPPSASRSPSTHQTYSPASTSASSPLLKRTSPRPPSPSNPEFTRPLHSKAELESEQNYVPASPFSGLSSNDLNSSNLGAGIQTDTEIVLKAQRAIGRNPLQLLCPLPEASRIAVLSAGQVILLDLSSLSLVEKMAATKGASAMTRGLISRAHSAIATSKSTTLHGGGSYKSITEEPGELLLVSVKKKLLLFKVFPLELVKNKKSKGLSSDGSIALPTALLVKEMVTGVEGVLTMACLENSVFVGTQRELIMFSILDGHAIQLFSRPEESPWKPLLKPIPKDLEVLLLIDNVGIIVNQEGQPVGGSVFFGAIPDAIGQSPPYVLVLRQGVLDLFHSETGQKLQSLSFDATTGPHLVADNDDGSLLVVANASKICGLVRVPLDEQAKELLKKKEFEEAISLAKEGVMEGEETADERLAIVYAEAGFLQLFDLHFKEAIDNLLLSKIVEPAELFPFFPSLTFRWRALVPRKRYWGLHPPPQPLVLVIQNGLLAFQKGLLEPPIENNEKRENSLVGISSKRAASGDHFFTLASESFIRYWKVVRQSNLSPAVKEGVDTILMMLYIEVGASEELQQLAASANSCLLEEVESLLRGSGQLQALALLYESKQLWSSALDIWQKIVEDGPVEALPSTASALQSSRDNATGAKILSASQLAAASEAARLLEMTSDSSLVLQHLRWILKVDLDLGMRILSSTKRVVPLPPEDVLEILRFDETILYERYLQWHVLDQGSQNSRYHTELALSLGKSALDAINCEKTVSELENSGSLDLSQINDVICNCGRQSERADATGFKTQGQILSIAADAGYSQRKSFHVVSEVRGRLQRFLSMSNLYDTEAVLASICNTELWLEQAILYKKRGDEIPALRILALKLEDSEAAEKYCAELGRPNAYMQLLDMYLKPGEGKDPMYGPAVRLLHSHGASLDPLQVLEALSPDMPLQLACQTLARMLQARVHYHREGQIVRNLSRAVNLDSRIARVEEKSRHVQITDESLCGSCGARIGTKLFALYPNDALACFKCLRRYGEFVCPVTGRNFEVLPAVRRLHDHGHVN